MFYPFLLSFFKWGSVKIASVTFGTYDWDQPVSSRSLTSRFGRNRLLAVNSRFERKNKGYQTPAKLAECRLGRDFAEITKWIIYMDLHSLVVVVFC